MTNEANEGVSYAQVRECVEAWHRLEEQPGLTDAEWRVFSETSADVLRWAFEWAQSAVAESDRIVAQSGAWASLWSETAQGRMLIVDLHGSTGRAL